MFDFFISNPGIAFYATLCVILQKSLHFIYGMNSAARGVNANEYGHKNI